MNMQDDPETLKIKAARELVQKAARLGLFSPIPGSARPDTTKWINSQSMWEQTARYVAITKAVTLYKNMELLRGVEIVDTPGFKRPGGFP